MRTRIFVLVLAAASPAFASPQRCAHITAGGVDNVVIADPVAGLPAGVDCSNPVAQIGWTFAGGVYTPVTPPVVYQISGLSFLQFMALFSAAEQAAIVTSADTQVRLFVLMAGGAGSIDLTNSQVVAGVNYLASINLIAQSRAAAVLSGAPPT
jgi:hypothetical protein